MNREEAKAKVAKLLKLAKDDGAAENEAERAMSQAEALMRKFGIEAGELVDGGTLPGFEWGSQFSAYGNKYHQAKSLPRWYQYISVGVAKFTDTIVRSHVHRELGMGCGFYGEVSDVAFAAWLNEYLRDAVQRTAAEQDLGRAERESFRVAMALRLVARMKELRTERDKAFQGGTGTALVVVSHKLTKRNQEFGAPQYKANKARITNRDAAEAGISAADKVGFNRPLAAGADKARLAAGADKARLAA